MTESLWQLLLQKPSDLSCDECFAVMEYHAEVLARGGADLLPEIMQQLARCPSCRAEHRAALGRLAKEPERAANPAGKSEATVTHKENDRE